MSPERRAALIAAVQASPDAVARHDRAAWVGLFATDGEVNDPVGSRPHRGRAAIERFYDTFIAPNRIRFRVDHDIVCGMSVVRDLTIETTMSTGVVLNVPMHLRYELVEEGDALRISRLFAHWELGFMIGQLLRTGVKGLLTSLKLSVQMLRHQGLGGIAGFMRGFAGAGAAGKRRAIAFLDALRRGDTGSAGVLLADGAAISLSELQAQLGPFSWSKPLAAGRGVTVSLQVPNEGGAKHGVALIGFARRGLRIESVHLYL